MSLQSASAPKATAPSAQHLYTLQFKNGHLLKHQDTLALSQYRFDGRLASVYREEQEAEFTSKFLTH